MTLTGNGSNEGTNFVVALSPASISTYDGELIITARQTTDVTIATGATSEIVTVYENVPLYYDVDNSMRTTTGVEEKGTTSLGCSKELKTCVLSSLVVAITRYGGISHNFVAILCES